VIKIVPKDKLLILKIEEDYKTWDKLCTFLNKPVPSIPFPRTNDRENMLKVVRTMKVIGYANKFMIFIGIPSTVIAAIIFFLRRRK